MRRIVALVWLNAVWVTLWESLSWANVIGGVLVALAVLHLIPPRDSGVEVGFHLLAAARLVFYFLGELLKASALMAWEVLTPRNRINAAVVSVQLESGVPGILSAVANMVSLTPGTVTLEVDERERTLFIHVLHLQSLEDIRESVRYLEKLTLRAFPPLTIDFSTNGVST